MAPRVRVRDTGGTLRTLTRIRARDTAGTLRAITRIRARDASGAVRVVYDSTGASTFSASAAPGTVGGSGIGTATTTATTVTPTGGTAPYTYAWSLLSYTHQTTAPTAAGPTSATTTFTQTNMDPLDGHTSEWRCTVTDSSTPALTTTADVTAIFSDTTP